MSKELYLLVDGTHADPDECDVGADDELRHMANGTPVALRGDGLPQTVQQGAIDNMNVAAARSGEEAAKEAEQIIAAAAAAVEQGQKDPPLDQPSDAEPLLTTADLNPPETETVPPPAPPPSPSPPPPTKAAARPRKAKVAKNREIRTR